MPIVCGDLAQWRWIASITACLFRNRGIFGSSSTSWMKMVGTSGTQPTTLLDTARYSVAGDNQSRIVLMVPVVPRRAWRWTVFILSLIHI